VSNNQREVDLPDESEAPAEVRGAFWSLVAVFNAAILAMSVGAMLVGFRGQWTTGGGLLVAGLLSFAFGVVRVRRVKDRLGDDEGAPADR
jgi:hypothetical protein